MEHKKAGSIVEKYLRRSVHTDQLFDIAPDKNIGGFVVIPSYGESQLMDTLESIRNCSGHRKDYEIIIIINDREDSPEDILEENISCLKTLGQAINQLNTETLRFLYHHAKDLNAKDGGVGLARKIGMDEALRRSHFLEKRDLPIICLDADCKVSENYLSEIEGYFENHDNAPGASIYFEHEYDNEAIILYELFLRYYVNALRTAGFPYAYHTVGSSMAVRSDVYAMEGGMNKRKAGEDFYFIHKIIPRGNFGEITACKVIPSSRESDRVPFGTGRAMMEFNKSPNRLNLSYDFRIFLDLKDVLSAIDQWYINRNSSVTFKAMFSELPESFRSFCGLDDFIWQIREAAENSKEKRTFIKRIYQWLDAFTILKYVHFTRDNTYPNRDIGQMCIDLLAYNGLELDENYDFKSLLETFRKIDKKGILLDKMAKV